MEIIPFQGIAATPVVIAIGEEPAGNVHETQVTGEGKVRLDPIIMERIYKQMQEDANNNFEPDELRAQIMRTVAQVKISYDSYMIFFKIMPFHPDSSAGGGAHLLCGDLATQFPIVLLPDKE